MALVQGRAAPQAASPRRSLIDVLHRVRLHAEPQGARLVIQPMA